MSRYIVIKFALPEQTTNDEAGQQVEEFLAGLHNYPSEWLFDSSEVIDE